jgi:glycosyltransferase involved in cell wall biosynthesis
MEKRIKPRFMLVGMGVLGGGSLGEGIPVLHDLFDRLSNHYDITYYSFTSIREVHVPKSIKIRQVISWKIPGRLKYVLLSLRAVWDHLIHPYAFIFSVSVYPTGLFAIWLGRILNRPVIIQLIALEAVALSDIGYGNLTKPWLKRITQKVCQSADSLVVVSDYQAEIAKQSLPMTREMIVLPLRINPKKFVYRKRSISMPVQFIQIAYYSLVKDQDTLFTAFASVANHMDCHLTVIGEGFNIPKVNNLLKTLKIADKVTLVGHVKQSELPSYFEDAHILLHSARFETGCAAIQEAMASGVAVCGTNVGLLADIGAGYAVVVPSADHTQMAAGIFELINDTLKFENITANAYQWICANDAVWAAKNYKLFLDKVVNQSTQLES